MGTNYYLRKNVCTHCNKSWDDEIHIGKQSFGWKFLYAPWLAPIRLDKQPINKAIFSKIMEYTDKGYSCFEETNKICLSELFQILKRGEVGKNPKGTFILTAKGINFSQSEFC